jgi:hypothetical protein
MSSAAAPLTWAAAMLVPSNSSQPRAGHRPQNAFSRREQVGLGPAISGRPPARKEANLAGVWGVAVSGPDRDHALSIPRIRNADSGISLEKTTARVKCDVAEVAGGGDHNDAISDQLFALETHRTLAAGIVSHIVRKRKA